MYRERGNKLVLLSLLVTSNMFVYHLTSKKAAFDCWLTFVLITDNNLGVIVPAVIGAVAIVAMTIISFVLCCCCKRWRRRKKKRKLRVYPYSSSYNKYVFTDATQVPMPQLETKHALKWTPIKFSPSHDLFVHTLLSISSTKPRIYTLGCWSTRVKDFRMASDHSSSLRSQKSQFPFVAHSQCTLYHIVAREQLMNHKCTSGSTAYTTDGLSSKLHVSGSIVHVKVCVLISRPFPLMSHFL